MRWARVATAYVMSRDAMCHRGVWKGALLKSLSLQRFSAKMLLLRLLLWCSKLLPENESPSLTRGRRNFFDLFLFRLTALNEMNSPESSKKSEIWKDFTRIKWKPSPNLPEPGHIASGDSKNWWQWGIFSETEELWSLRARPFPWLGLGRASDDNN